MQDCLASTGWHPLIDWAFVPYDTLTVDAQELTMESVPAELLTVCQSLACTLEGNLLTMKFIEMTGAMLEQVVNDGEIHSRDLQGAGVKPDSIIRVNQQGDIEVRRPNKWDVVGGLLGNFEERIKKTTGFDWA